MFGLSCTSLPLVFAVIVAPSTPPHGGSASSRREGVIIRGQGTDESHSGEEHTREWARAVAAGAGARGGGLRLLRLSGAGKVGEFVANKETGVLADPTLREVLLSSFTALAGATMVLAYRRSVIAGPLVALAIVPAAMVGVALAAARLMLAY